MFLFGRMMANWEKMSSRQRWRCLLVIHGIWLIIFLDLLLHGEYRLCVIWSVPMFVGHVLNAIANSFAHGVGSIFWPDDKFSCPQPLFSPLLNLKKEGRYQDAMNGLTDIAEKFPGDSKAYIEMLDIQFTCLKSPEQGRAIYAWACSRITDTSERAKLDSAFTMLNSQTGYN